MRRTPNPDYRKFECPEGYEDLGFINDFKEGSYESNIVRSAYGINEQLIDNSEFLYRGTDVIMVCHQLKVVWHVDMSD